MSALFYVSGAIAVIAALMVVTRANAMHALIYLLVAFLATASVFFSLGAPFAAVLQIVVYAGAIIVLFVFAVMMLGRARLLPSRHFGSAGASPSRRVWVVPIVLAGILLVQLIVALAGRETEPAGAVIGPKDVGMSLFTNYLIGVELASMLLLAALVAAFHFGMFRDLGSGHSVGSRRAEIPKHPAEAGNE